MNDVGRSKEQKTFDHREKPVSTFQLSKHDTEEMGQTTQQLSEASQNADLLSVSQKTNTSKQLIEEY